MVNSMKNLSKLCHYIWSWSERDSLLRLMSSSGERYNWWPEDDRWPEDDIWRTDGHRLFLTFVCITCSLQVRTDDGQTVIDWWSEDDYSLYLFPDVRIHYLQFTSTCELAQMYRQKRMPGGRRMTDRRLLSGSLNVTAGSVIRDSEGGATAQSLGKQNQSRQKTGT